MEISDFKPEGNISVSDFSHLEYSVGIPVGSSTTAQLAATETLMSPEPSIDEFRQIREDLSSQKGREKFILQQQIRRDDILNDSKYELSNILLDGGLSADEKFTFVDAARNADTISTRSTLDTMAEEYLVADNGIDETEQSNESRTLMLDSINAVNANKRELTSMINALELGKHSTNGDKIREMGELITPFAEWIFIDRLVRKTVDEDRRINLGQQKQQLFEQIRKAPISERTEMMEGLIKLVTENDTLIFPDGNDMVALDTLQKMAGVQDYSNTERWFDNIVNILDVTGISFLARGIAKGGKGAAASSAVITKTTHTNVVPTSPSQVLKDANPEAARGVHITVADDATGEAAEALHGTTREEALAKDLLPEPEVTPGVVDNKVSMTGPQFEEPELLRSTRTERGGSEFTEAEVKSAQVGVVNKLENIEGMKAHDESMTVRLNDDGSTTFRAIYHPTDSGFKTAGKAISNATYAFRHFGLTEENFVLYARQGDKWVETTKEELAARSTLREGFKKVKQEIPEALKEIDYAVGIDYRYTVRPEDIGTYERFTVNWNFADYLPNLGPARINQGSVTQHLLPADSVLHKQITRPANAAVDRSVHMRKLFVDTFEAFGKAYSKLKPANRSHMSNYIHEANFKGIRFDTVDLRARGFNDDEIAMLKDWRAANDALYHSTNQDMAISLRNRGYKVYTDSSNTHLVVRPLTRGAVNSKTQYFNPQTNAIESMGIKDLDDWYDNGGSFAKLSEPTQINGIWVDHIKVADTSDGGFTRSIKDNDTVMNYRDGYYPVMYDANFFITKKVVGADGVENTKVVGSARTKQEAIDATEALADFDPKAQFTFREDRRNEVQKANELGEDSWSLTVNSGLSNQRLRGERLVDVGVDLHKAGSTNLLDPLEAVSRQIGQLSEHVTLRPYLDATKNRWIDNYADELDLPVNKFGEVGFPSSINDIKGKPKTSMKTVADAKTMFNYLHSLENGYINGIDQSMKALMHFGADVAHVAGKGKTEGSLRGANGNVTSAAKGAVFKMFLASNPARQLLVQGHQTVQLTAIAPEYMIKGGLAKDSWRIGQVMRGLSKDPEALKMLEEIQKSGMLEAVDANNLVRQDQLRLAEITAMQKIRKGAATPVNLLQRVGFDVGEQSVLVTSWLAHRDKALKAGKTLNRRTYEEIAGQARAFTYSMNKAGDMPYNQNTLNVVAQFLQVPHKALLQPLTSRTLTGKEKAQLMAFNTVMYGVPAGVMANYIYPNMEQSTARDALEHGLEDVILNHVATMVTGEKQQIDWGDLAPSDMHGMGDFAVSLATLDIGKLVAEAPATSLFFGANPRLTNMWKTTARYFHLTDDYDDPLLDTKYTDVGLAALNLFSGYSNAFKANYAYQSGLKMSSLGNVTDSEVTSFEAKMQFFGFQTKTESGIRRSKELVYGDSDYDPSDVALWLNEVKRQMARRGQTTKQKDFSRRVLQEGLRVFEPHQAAFRKELLRLIQKDVSRGEYDFIKNILKQTGSKTNNEVREMIEVLPPSKFKDGLMFGLESYVEAETSFIANREKGK